tara:strand:+ start:3899 stop:4273 length:375 start_codon:yes stop_codon:yes gene_type:complete
MTATFHFPNALNVSVQVGDTAYWCPTTPIASFDTATQSSIVEIGRIIQVIGAETGFTSGSITVETDLYLSQLPQVNVDYMFFSKDNITNLTSLLGYYASIEYKNNSKTEAEMFQTTVEVFQSSK